MPEFALGVPTPQVNGGRADRHPVAVVAFGGNAILRSGQRGTVEEQADNLSLMARQLAGMVKAGWGVVVTHGNGPQVGNIKLQQEAAEQVVPGMPLDVCGAMSQGQLGYLISQAFSQEFAHQGIDFPVVSVVTRCAVAADDPAFTNPTKPIGPFYDQESAARLHSEKGWTVVPDSGRGYRRVVPSPVPQRIVETRAIRSLIQSGCLVVASGGGGIPVLDTPSGAYQGVEAVIDKDLAACLLAKAVGADALVLLTEVPQVFIHYGTAEQRGLEDLTMDQVRSLIADGHFPSGSMGPKVQAAVDFLLEGGRLAIITNPGSLLEALAGKAGTRLHSRPAIQLKGNGVASAGATLTPRQ